MPDPKLNEGRTLVVSGIELEPNTSYTLTIFSAVSKEGNTMAEPVHVQFSTGESLVALGSLAGSVSLSEDVAFVVAVQPGVARVKETVVRAPSTPVLRLSCHKLTIIFCR